jgi:hypothetical protein
VVQRIKKTKQTISLRETLLTRPQMAAAREDGRKASPRIETVETMVESKRHSWNLQMIINSTDSVERNNDLYPIPFSKDNFFLILKK